MDRLRSELEKALLKYELSNDRVWQGVNDILAIVKSEPSGVVVKKECPESTDYLRFHGKHPLWCRCEGTGIISRELSKEELAEVTKLILKGEARLHNIQSNSIDGFKEYRVITLPSGEFLELKEGE